MSLSGIVGSVGSRRSLAEKERRQKEAAAPAGVELYEKLAELVRAELLEVAQQRAAGGLVYGDEEERVYSFKHSMVQQVTYSMILFQERH